jgi:hypothetical protein
MLRLETAVYAALRLDFKITASEAEIANRASNGAQAGGPRCTAMQRGPQRVATCSSPPGVLADYHLIVEGSLLALAEGIDKTL